MNGHIVVTGCAGFIGSHLADRPLADGHVVVGFDSSVQSHVRALRPSVAVDDICMLSKRR